MTKRLECQRCGYTWRPRVPRPKQCPACKNTRWQQPREGKRGIRVPISKYSNTHWHLYHPYYYDEEEGVIMGDPGPDGILCLLAEPGVVCDAKDRWVDEVHVYPTYDGWEDLTDTLTWALTDLREKGRLPLRIGEVIRHANRKKKP